MSEQQPRILLIEDDQALGEIYLEVFELEEIATEWIDNGRLAQQRLKEVVPELILLDLHLPGVSGKSLLAQIKADERLAQTRVVIVSADAIQARELSNEVELVLLKPVSYKQLLNIAKRLLPSK